MDYRILGPLEVVRDGEILDLGPRKQRSLLALLLINANRVVSTDRILEELWGDEAAGKENALWVYISRLRSILEPDRNKKETRVLVTQDHGYVLRAPRESIDANVFEVRVAEAGSTLRDDPESAAESLRSALDLWRGDPLQDFAYDDFAGTEITRLTELRMNATGDLMDAELRRGRSGELIGELETQAIENPLRERPVGQLMLALYRAGRPADALRAYQRFQKTVGEELGIDPSPELARLEEQILLHDTRLIPTSVAATRARRAAENPFKGLRAFSEGDAENFFGRDRLVADVVRRLGDDSRLIALIGASGSGKSSAVRAGLIPAIRKGAVPGSEEWLVAQMVPGSHPFAELEAALLRSTLDAPDSLRDQLAEGDDGLLRAALRVLPSEHSKLLLFIDQFEELFTLLPDAEARERFLANLLTAVEEPHGRCFVVVTMRADFYARPLEHHEFGDRLSTGVVNVVPLRPDELEAVIEEPARRSGVAVEPALLAEMISDVVGQPGALPMLQYTLTELFDRRQNDTLTAADYQDIGGVRGALTRRAEDLYSDLNRQEREAARQLFLRLVAIGDGVETSRRRVRGSEIASIDVDPVDTQRVIETFGSHRLLTFDSDPVSGAPTVEVAHEALLGEWERLREWIDDGRDDLRRQATLETAARDWRAADESLDYLFTGTRLAEFDRWRDSTSLALTAMETEFLDASIEQREKAESQQAARDEEARRLRRRARTRPLVAAAAVLAAVAAYVIFVALRPGPTQMVAVTEADAAAVRSLEAAVDRLNTDGLIDGRVVAGSEDTIRTSAEAGANIVLVDPGVGLGGMAAEFPEVGFVSFDDIDPPSGVRSIVFTPQEQGFLAGVVAALASGPDILGFHAPLRTERAELVRAGYEHGARLVNPDAQVFSAFNGTFSGTEEEARATLDNAARLFGRGVDVVYTLGDVSLIASQARIGSADRWVIGGSGADDWLSIPEALRPQVLTSIVRNVAGAIENVVADFETQGPSPGVELFGLPDGFTLADFREAWKPSESDLSTIDSLARQVGDGTIVVDRASDHLAVFPERPEINPIATLHADGSCAYAARGPLLAEPEYTSGTTVGIDFLNRTSAPAGISVVSDGRIPELQARTKAGTHTGLFTTLEPGRYEVYCLPDLDDTSTRILATTFTVPDPNQCTPSGGRDDSSDGSPVERIYRAIRDRDLAAAEAEFAFGATVDLGNSTFDADSWANFVIDVSRPSFIKIYDIVVGPDSIIYDEEWIDRSGLRSIFCESRATLVDGQVSEIIFGPPLAQP